MANENNNLLTGRRAAGLPCKLALVLGSGGARGLAHLGVLRAFRELGVRPDCVIGTSIGAIVGAFYASGAIASADEIVRSMDIKHVAQLFIEVGLPHSGLLEGRHVMKFLREMIPAHRIDELPVRFAAVATDLLTQEEVDFQSGDLFKAIRASISIPGFFSPVEEKPGQWLIDGGLVNPLPVSLARSFRARRVIGVDVNLGMSGEAEAKRKPGAPSLFEVLLRTVRLGENAITRERLLREPPDLLIQPPVGEVGTMDFFRGESIVELGYRAAWKKAKEIRALVKELDTEND